MTNENFKNIISWAIVIILFVGAGISGLVLAYKLSSVNLTGTNCNSECRSYIEYHLQAERCINAEILMIDECVDYLSSED